MTPSAYLVWWRVGRAETRKASVAPANRPGHSTTQRQPPDGLSSNHSAPAGQSGQKRAKRPPPPAPQHSPVGCGEVQRGYLLNLRVKVPSAQIPVWRRSHIRQSTGATLTAESPDVNVLKRGRETPDQPRRLANRRAVARANGLIAEIPPSVELVAGYSECQAFPSPTRWPVLVRKKLGSGTHQAPGGS